MKSSIDPENPWVQSQHKLSIYLYKKEWSTPLIQEIHESSLKTNYLSIYLYKKEWSPPLIQEIHEPSLKTNSIPKFFHSH